MIRFKLKQQNILDFDIENRPLSYWIPDRPTAEVTAIAWSWEGSYQVQCELLTPREHSMVDMLVMFKQAYNHADIVTGHYIRRHDLPIINGAMVENGLTPLKPKLTSDTKLDLIKWKDLPQSQEYLGEMFGIAAPKVNMSQHAWREANRLSEAGQEATETRVKADVIQHKLLRRTLVAEGLLKPPRVWQP